MLLINYPYPPKNAACLWKKVGMPINIHYIIIFSGGKTPARDTTPSSCSCVPEAIIVAKLVKPKLPARKLPPRSFGVDGFLALSGEKRLTNDGPGEMS